MELENNPFNIFLNDIEIAGECFKYFDVSKISEEKYGKKIFIRNSFLLITHEKKNSKRITNNLILKIIIFEILISTNRLHISHIAEFWAENF